MALSLREKLKSAGSGEKKPRPAASSGGKCLVRTEEKPADAMGLPPRLSGSVLTLMQGRPFGDADREELLFLDTETTGLSGGAGTLAFLVGIGYFEGGRFCLEQYLMREYDEEASLIARTIEKMKAHPVLCTFNGATFDVPLLAGRAVLQRARLPEAKGHIDLLHTARRVWRMRLKKCSLQNIEEKILGMKREDDLPGSLVPETYFRFMKTRDMSLLEGILEHNALDIESLQVILGTLMKCHEDPTALTSGADLYSMGRIHEKRGLCETAGKCYRAAGQRGMAFLSQTRMAEMARRQGRYDAAAEMYESALKKRQSVQIHIALAKIYEHRLRDARRALEHAGKAMLLTDAEDEAAQEALMKRIRRLNKKTGGTGG